MTELAFSTAQSGLDAQRANIQNITNNLANVNTVGFKRGRIEYADQHYIVMRQAGGQQTAETKDTTGLQAGTGVKVVGTRKVFEQGSHIQTNNPFDVAIQGDGFFQATTDDGQKVYTRAGQFQVDEQGRLLFATNSLLLDPPVTLPEGTKNISIGKDGTISVIVAGDSEPQEVGKIQLASFMNPAGLLALGDNIYSQTAASGEPQIGDPGGDTGLGTVNQGALESSNVNVVKELVDLLEGQRAYEICARALETTDQMMEYANQRIGS